MSDVGVIIKAMESN